MIRSSPSGVMVTGHRFTGIPGVDEPRIREQLVELTLELTGMLDCRVVHSGMALGVDSWFAEEAIKLNLSLVAHVPFRGQALRWSTLSREHYQGLLDQADEVLHYAGDRYPGHWIYHHRNEKMVTASRAAIAVWDGVESTGGTATTVKLLRRHIVPWVHLDPHTHAVTVYRGRELLGTTVNELSTYLKAGPCPGG